MQIKLNNIKDFPSKQAEEIQNKLKELDNQGKLLDYFKEQYPNLGAENSLANYIIKHWETRGKQLYLEYTGIIVEGTQIKQVGIKPTEISYGTQKQLLWKCSECQYEFVSRLNDRTSKHQTDCPVCSGKIIDSGRNSFESWANSHGAYGKRVLEEFSGEDINGNKLNACDIPKTYSEQVIWKCKDCGHIWKATVLSRTGTNPRCCPACNSRANRLIKGVNDLETFCKQHPEFSYILEEFMGIDENGIKLKPSEISKGNNTRKVWFRCRYCREKWLARVSGRIINKSGCPKCCKSQTSFPEQYIFKALKEVFNQTQSRAMLFKETYSRGIEYDIYIPLKFKHTKTQKEYEGVCIEYNSIWHEGKEERDKFKEELCNTHGLYYIAVYEYRTKKEYKEVTLNNYMTTYGNQYNEDSCSRLNEIIHSIINQIKITNDIKINTDEIYTKAAKSSIKQIKTLGDIPELWIEAAELNENAESISQQSRESIKWKCPNCRYTWLNSPAGRIISKTGCARCGYNWYKELKGIKQTLRTPKYIKDTHPELFKELDKERNKAELGIDSTFITENSQVNLWWKCPKCSNNFRAVTADRIRHTTGCKQCHYNWYRAETGQSQKQTFAEKFPDKAKQIYFDANDLSNGHTKEEVLNCGPSSSIEIAFKCIICSNVFISTPRKIGRHTCKCRNCTNISIT